MNFAQMNGLTIGLMATTEAILNGKDISYDKYEYSKSLMDSNNTKVVQRDGNPNK